MNILIITFSLFIFLQLTIYFCFQKKSFILAQKGAVDFLYDEYFIKLAEWMDSNLQSEKVKNISHEQKEPEVLPFSAFNAALLNAKG